MQQKLQRKLYRVTLAADFGFTFCNDLIVASSKTLQEKLLRLKLHDATYLQLVLQRQCNTSYKENCVLCNTSCRLRFYFLQRFNRCKLKNVARKVAEIEVTRRSLSAACLATPMQHKLQRKLYRVTLAVDFGFTFCTD